MTVSIETSRLYLLTHLFLVKVLRILRLISENIEHMKTLEKMRETDFMEYSCERCGTFTVHYNEEVEMQHSSLAAFRCASWGGGGAAPPPAPPPPRSN